MVADRVTLLRVAFVVCIGASWRSALAQDPEGAQGEPREPAPAARGPGAPPRWMVALDLEQGWESNVRLSQTDDRGDFHGRVGVVAARMWQTDRTRIALTGGGGATLFRELTDQNRATYTVGAGVDRRLTRRLDGRLGVTYQTAFTRGLATTATAGLELPLILAHTKEATGGASYRLSPTATVALESRYTDVSFDSTLLVGGRTIVSRLMASRQVSPATTLALGYEHQLSSSRDGDANGHTMFGEWRLRTGRAMTARLMAGAAWAQSLGSSSASPLSAVGAAELRAQFVSDALEASLQRSVSQGFGLGRVIGTTRLAAGYDRRLTRDVSVSLRGEHAWSGDPADPRFSLHSGDGTLDVRWQLARNVVATVGAFARRREQGAQITSYGTQTGVVYRGLLP
jgi:opacity protein-like surface antigen